MLYGSETIVLLPQVSLELVKAGAMPVMCMRRVVRKINKRTDGCGVTVQKSNILISLGEPVGLIVAANLMVALHVLAGYQVYAFPLCKSSVPPQVPMLF